MAIFVDVGVMKLGLIVVICYLGTGNQFVIIVSGLLEILTYVSK